MIRGGVAVATPPPPLQSRGAGPTRTALRRGRRSHDGTDGGGRCGVVSTRSVAEWRRAPCPASPSTGSSLSSSSRWPRPGPYSLRAGAPGDAWLFAAHGLLAGALALAVALRSVEASRAPWLVGRAVDGSPGSRSD